MSKYLQLSSLLERRIQEGAYATGRVPTVREIADEYRVSALTASRALQHLQAKGLVRSVERVGTYLSPPTSPGERVAVLLRVSPGNWSPASTAVVQDGLDAVAARGEASFVPWPQGPSEGATDEELARQARQMRGEGAGGLLLLPSRVSEEACRLDERILAACKTEGLPAVLLDRNLRGEDRPLEHDLVSSDHVDGGRRSTAHLLALGRRRIACVIGSPCSSHMDREAGYRLALAQGGRRLGEELPALGLMPPAGLSGPGLFAWLAGRLDEFGADGVLCYQDYIAVGLVLELFRRGKRVPQDVAVVGCDNLPIGQSFSLGVTTYSYPSAELVRQGVRLLRARRDNPAGPPVKVVVAGDLIVRESTASR